ncbi:hypothetical protein [Yunchengibacter salinarum]|uniref:hypothetical protein n=1 Tax=Yunchengibacter salinarum TaxID=3133399 RepID=UPI0035B68CA4
MIMKRFQWQDHFGSICDSPLEAMSPDNLPERHPAGDFYRYWMGLNDGAMPSRSAFRPQAAARNLRWMMVFDVNMDAPHVDFQLVLHGTSATQLTHGNFTGQKLEQFTARDCYHSRYQAMVNSMYTGQPVFGRVSVGTHSEFRVDVLTGMFPFAADDGLARLIMIGAPEEAMKRRFF